MTEAFAATGGSLWNDAWRRLRGNRAALVACALLVLLVVAALIGPTFSPWSVDKVDWSLGTLASPPSLAGAHWFGTDANGRDLFVRVWVGTRISLLVALLATAVSLVIGVAWGATAGYVGGRLDGWMMRFVDVLYALPYMFFVILLTVVFGRSLFLIFLAIILIGNALWRRVIAVLLTVPVLTIGLSRIYDGAHWPTDVLGGYLIGGVWLALTIGLYREAQGWLERRREHRHLYRPPRAGAGRRADLRSRPLRQMGRRSARTQGPPRPPRQRGAQGRDRAT